MSHFQRSTTTYSVHKETALTSPRKSIAESKLKETGKSSTTAGLETNQYPSDSILQSSGLCISRGKDLIVFCVKSTKQQILKTKSLNCTVEPAVRIKEQTFKSHLDCSAHQRAVSGELLNSASIRPCCRSCRWSVLQCFLCHVPAGKTLHCKQAGEQPYHFPWTSWLWSEVIWASICRIGERDYSAHCPSDPRQNCPSSQIICYLWYPHGWHDRCD